MPRTRNATLTHPTQNESGGRLRGWIPDVLRGSMRQLVVCGTVNALVPRHIEEKIGGGRAPKPPTASCRQPAAVNMPRVIPDRKVKDQSSVRTQHMTCETE